MRLSSIAVVIAISFGLFLSEAASNRAVAMDFLEKRECTIGGLSHTPVHTRCVISGGIQNGTIDVSIKTPDGKRYALEGPIDGADGDKYLLEHRPARRSDDVGDSQCYRRTDALLELCIGKLAE